MQTKLFRSGDVSRWAAIDIKTLHNWTRAGKVKALPTHGRHLRFDAAEVHKLLTFLGMPIPEEVKAAVGEDKSASVAAAIELVHTVRFVAGRDPTEDDESWLVDVHRRIARVSDEGLRAGDLGRNGIDLQTAGGALRAGVLRAKEGT